LQKLGAETRSGCLKMRSAKTVEPRFLEPIPTAHTKASPMPSGCLILFSNAIAYREDTIEPAVLSRTR